MEAGHHRQEGDHPPELIRPPRLSSSSTSSSSLSCAARQPSEVVAEGSETAVPPSQTRPVMTLAGGLYTVNVTYDAGTVHVHSTWAHAKIVGSVSVDAPMAIYELDRVLLPDTLFHAQPPVADVPATPAPSKEDSGEPVTEPDPVVTAQYGSPGVADAPVSACGDDDGRFACYAAAAALGAVMALVAL